MHTQLTFIDNVTDFGEDATTFTEFLSSKHDKINNICLLVSAGVSFRVQS